MKPSKPLDHGRSPVAPCSARLLKLVFLRHSLECKTLEYEKLSSEEQELVQETMFGGRYWVDILLDVMDNSESPFSDYVRSEIIKRQGGGNASPSDTPQ